MSASASDPVVSISLAILLLIPCVLVPPVVLGWQASVPSPAKAPLAPADTKKDEPRGRSAAKGRPAEKKPAGSEAPEIPWSAKTWKGLALRSIGPALTSGRIGDIAVDPTDKARWFVAAASGGVWRTENAGVTWTPVFDGERSYSIGCVAIDPHDPLTIWVGTGENNNQRSVGYGDGVYRSIDGGKTWKRVGLEHSEHIGRILVHPKDSKTVYVAAQGPLWAPGGDRGLYRTTDGGETWRAILTISENTGVTDVVMDPRDPDVLIAAAHQRRRHVWTYISGGPESAIYKSTDGGEHWRKITAGLPTEDLGRIGLAFSPVAPGLVYAIVEAAEKVGGFFRSTDRGESWEKRSDYQTAGNYYSEIAADPREADRVYSMDVFLQVTDDAGKTFRNLGERFKHVDNHAIWVDPDDPRHYLVGGDGGLYESWDGAKTWDFKANLPVTQFYRVAVDGSSPVYHVYGGTQDNFSLGGPSRTLTAHGITNQDWFVTWGGDGFHTRVDPDDPSIVYATLQYGVLSRYDRKSGESLLIQPQEAAGDAALRWNWDSPLLISPHSHTRLYFAANRVYRSDDRGNSWKAASPDLTRQLDRNQLKVMGRLWGPDAIAKNSSTSFYGNIVSLDESPRVEGLLYVGTDDGLVQVSEDGGASWRRVEKFAGVPDMTYVSDLFASQHAPDVVYAAFNNHKNGDFKPYLLRSADRGRTWTSIAGDLPGAGPVWTIAEDHVAPGLLFAGTEFGLFFSSDGGSKWVKLEGGLPTIAVRDLAIQPRADDLVVATFGRGIYILDDYTPLRAARPADLDQDTFVFPVRPAIGFIPAAPLGMKEKSFQGESFYAAPNPPFGAVFTYYLKEEVRTRKKKRQEAEKAADKSGEPVTYPSREQLEAEAREEEPAVVVTIGDPAAKVVRRLVGPAAAGVHRISWDLRYPPSTPTTLKALSTDNPFVDPPEGPIVVPGKYTATFSRRVDGGDTPFGAPQTFEVSAPGISALPPADRAQLLAFQQKVARLQRAVLGAIAVARDTKERLQVIKKAIDDTPGADAALASDARAIEARLLDLRTVLSGDEVMRSHNEPVPLAIADRVEAIVNTQWKSSSAATATSEQGYDIAASAFATALEQLRTLVEGDLARLESRMESAGAPWTPGRLPQWRKE